MRFPRPRLPRTLTFRLGLLTALWVAAGLVVVWIWAAQIVEDGIARVFDARLVSLLDALVASAVIEDGKPRLLRPVSEPRFDQPLSGMYFEIQSPSGMQIVSRSLWDHQLAPVQYDHTDVLASDIPGPLGQKLRLMERDVVLPGTSGPMHILVAADRTESMAATVRIKRLLGLACGVLGFGLVGVVVLQVSAGLRGLRKLSDVVADLRAGRRNGIDLDVPVEVVPLFAEIDTLVRQNRATVERARGHVGNLAHTLRTRLSIIRNAAEADDLATIRREIEEADRLVQHHLSRARVAPLSGSAAMQTSLVRTIEGLQHALLVLFPTREFILNHPAKNDCIVRCESEDVAEMFGNILENACKWARSRIIVDITGYDDIIVVAVSDDGPGIPADQLSAVTHRGTRADEAIPGSGLGLAITTDLVALYDGRFALISPGRTGGLTVEVTLPALPQIVVTRSVESEKNSSFF